eukprot:TRINITY_DN10751_c0_g1_i1.p1 TRINITY_DN10751_c0_g1~~TRINITY_DN10751_c0_g1_i1.p1  ORF type:complete len:279 (-),score=71.00 TRINITY_DN10751_c0_g1_i1:84-920(-)
MSTKETRQEEAMSSGADEPLQPRETFNSTNQNSPTQSIRINEEENNQEKSGSTSNQSQGSPSEEPFEDILVSGWLYLDAEGKRQGPFSTIEMKEWWIGGFFDPNLLVKRVQENDYLKISERSEFRQLDRSGSVHSMYHYDYYGVPESIYNPTSDNPTDNVDLGFPPDSFGDLTPTEYVDEFGYEQKGFFNTKTGRFQSSGDYSNHWEKKGLPSDRDGRMMAHYFDLDAYQEQMREAKRRKLEEPEPIVGKKPSKKAIIAYYKKKKEERKRKKLLQNYG